MCGSVRACVCVCVCVCVYVRIIVAVSYCCGGGSVGMRLAVSSVCAHYYYFAWPWCAVPVRGWASGVVADLLTCVVVVVWLWWWRKGGSPLTAAACVLDGWCQRREEGEEGAFYRSFI